MDGKQYDTRLRCIGWCDDIAGTNECDDFLARVLLVELAFYFRFELLFLFLFFCVDFQNYDVSKIIHEKGCIQAGEEWMERNMLSVASCTVFIIFFQVIFFLFRLLDATFLLTSSNVFFSQILGICFAQNLRADIFAQKAKWH